MDIAALSTVSANVRIQQEVSVLNMKRAMELTEQNGQGIQQLIQSVGQSLEPHLGKKRGHCYINTGKRTYRAVSPFSFEGGRSNSVMYFQ